MKSNVIELPRPVPLHAALPEYGVGVRLCLAIRALIDYAWWLLDRLAAVFGYSRWERSVFERWPTAAGGGFFENAARRPSGRPGRLIDFEAARTARRARRR
jgi:hypothetical protein